MTLPYETLIGVSYGLLVGFLPAICIGLLALTVEAGLDRRLPVVAGVLAIPPALLTGLAVGIVEPTAGLEHGTRATIVATVAGLLGVTAASQGARVGTELPRDRSLPLVRDRTLAPVAIDAIDAAGQVTIRPTVPVRSIDGYPPLPPSLRNALEESAWRFPADLQLAELERRLDRLLRTEFGLQRVDVAVDARGLATIAVAPPANDLAGDLPDGQRAVPITGLVPAGVEPGDEVAIGTSSATERTTGVVLSVTPDRPNHDLDDGSTDTGATDDPPTGTLTVAIETADAGPVLDADRHEIAVLPDGSNPALEAVSLLERAGHPVRLIEPVADDHPLESTTIVGSRSGDRWTFPRSSADAARLSDSVASVDEAVVVGEPRGSGGSRGSRGVNH